MLAQAYHDGVMRIFDNHGNRICDMEFSQSSKEKADEQLKRLKMRRRESWQDREWGIEAKLRFDR